jgi:hypothetical protein
MTHGTPDPLKPGHIPGQNPDTLQRLPGHTRFYRQSYRSAIWLPALIAAGVIVFYALLLAGFLGSG